jgi:hypothetical protein
MTNKSYRVITDIQILQSATDSEKKKLREPSYMIQQLIKKTKGFPTWVSGFMLVNMSVTLIDQDIGNFDTCIMDHRHLHKEILRQLQRQNFNYERWSTENKAKIKTTKVYSFTKSVVDHILQYENDVERIISECSGKSCTLREIQGFGPEEPTLQEIKVTNLNSEFSNIIKNTANTQSLKFVAGTVVGTATATFIPTNKPGGATGNEWIKINIDGTDLYIPAWT